MSRSVTSIVASVLVNRYTLVMAGGALGSLARFAAQSWGRRLAGEWFPVGTVAVNVAGCFAIGFLNSAFLNRWTIPHDYRVAMLVGVLGGFTTFSAFGWETFSMASAGHVARAWANVALSVSLGLLAVWAGFHAAERLFPRP